MCKLHTGHNSTAGILICRNALLDLLMVKLPYVDKQRVKQIYATAIPNLQVTIIKYEDQCNTSYTYAGKFNAMHNTPSAFCVASEIKCHIGIFYLLSVCLYIYLFNCHTLLLLVQHIFLNT